MTGSRLPLLGTVAGILVGSVIAATLVASGVVTVPVRRDERDASADFLAAWERSRNGTFLVQGDFRRTLPDGRSLSSASELVQRPPDRIVRQFSGVQGTIDGHPIVCSTDQLNQYRCFTGNSTAPPYDETVRQELETFRSYFQPPAPGAQPLYRVINAPEPGCFELFQQLAYPDAPYGKYAKFCFDPATGARRYLQRQLESGVREIEEAVSITGRVLPTDLDIQQRDEYELRMDLGGFPAPVPASPPGTTADARTSSTVAPTSSTSTSTTSTAAGPTVPTAAGLTPSSGRGATGATGVASASPASLPATL